MKFALTRSNRLKHFLESAAVEIAQKELSYSCFFTIPLCSYHGHFPATASSSSFMPVIFPMGDRCGGCFVMRRRRLLVMFVFVAP